ncbi:hypothetical protein [Cysteiniphilum sp. 6C5]|uniref:hypothetical protein n=1 Tax=unclassified Cysteiniphilum TaxID=2610889 RepID=UPI003F835FC4
MLKSKKILMAGVVTALFSSACFADASDSVTKKITVEIEVGAKTLQDKLKMTEDTSTSAVKRGALETNKGTSRIDNFITWNDTTSGEVVVTVASGDKDGGSYVIKSGENKMPVAFSIDDKEINETSGSDKKLKLNSSGDTKELVVTYGDGSSAYPEGEYSGNFTFKISTDF